MAEIMQGTTPSVTIKISKNQFLLSQVTAIELYVRNDGKTTTYTMDQLRVDTVANTVTKTFTEEETAALKPRSTVIIQGRFWFANGNVVGINKITFPVADMMEVGADG